MYKENSKIIRAYLVVLSKNSTNPFYEKIRYNGSNHIEECTPYGFGKLGFRIHVKPNA